MAKVENRKEKAKEKAEKEKESTTVRSRMPFHLQALTRTLIGVVLAVHSTSNRECSVFTARSLNRLDYFYRIEKHEKGQ